jgi:hypothetical protein
MTCNFNYYYKFQLTANLIVCTFGSVGREQKGRALCLCLCSQIATHGEYDCPHFWRTGGPQLTASAPHVLAFFPECRPVRSAPVANGRVLLHTSASASASALLCAVSTRMADSTRDAEVVGVLEHFKFDETKQQVTISRRAAAASNNRPVSLSAAIHYIC